MTPIKIVAGFSLITMFTVVDALQLKAEGPMESPDTESSPTVVEEYSAHARAIAVALRESEGWDDPQRADDLTAMIVAAGTLRVEDATDTLIERIGYNPWLLTGDREQARGRGPIGDTFPTVGALIEIGLPAVPSLLDAMKADPQDDGERRRISMATTTLRLIYERGTTPNTDIQDREAQAIAMARLRIELEMQADPEARRQLAAALEHPMLRHR